MPTGINHCISYLMYYLFDLHTYHVLVLTIRYICSMHVIWFHLENTWHHWYCHVRQRTDKNALFMAWLITRQNVFIRYRTGTISDKRHVIKPNVFKWCFLPDRQKFHFLSHIVSVNNVWGPFSWFTFS